MRGKGDSVNMSLKIRAYAAGSLRKVLPVMLNNAGLVGELAFGPSGVLIERLVSGEQADLFLPASMSHALNFFEMGLGFHPRVFAHNELCLFGKSTVLEGQDALTTMLDPDKRLGTSTPVDDPGGDYAFAVFDKAEALIPGAAQALKKKALTLVGGKNSNIKEGSHSPVYVLFRESMVDLFLGYRTTAMDLVSRLDDIVMAELPKALQVKAEYGAVVVAGSTKGEQALNLLMKPEIRSSLKEYGFSC